MTNLISEQLQNYFDELETALKIAAPQKRDILDEIRNNTMERIAALCRSGTAEPQAVEQALEELGPPRELAISILKETPPFNSPVIIWTRYAVFAALLLFAIFSGFAFRASFFGPSIIFYATLVGVFLPPLLLCWPTIVWRVNWLFSFLPMVAVLAIIVFAASLGAQHSEDIHLSHPPGEVAVEESSGLLPMFATVLFTLLALYILSLVQQRRQLRTVISLTCLTLLIIEIPFYWEEQQIRNFASSVLYHQAENGRLPTEDEFIQKNDATKSSVKYGAATESHTFTIAKDRTLFPGHRIIYSGPEGNVFVTD
jgi:hypothetical protein